MTTLENTVKNREIPEKKKRKYQKYPKKAETHQKIPGKNQEIYYTTLQDIKNHEKDMRQWSGSTWPFFRGHKKTPNLGKIFSVVCLL